MVNNKKRSQKQIRSALKSTDSRLKGKGSNRTGYHHREVEAHWQSVWEKEATFYPRDITQVDANSTFYNLWMFPYPSAEGLHAGHAFASTGSDIYGRYMRMNGKSVFQPIGYDSFGIHSENFALKIGEHPSSMLSRTTKKYEEQLRSLGHGYDWTRTVTTSDIDYYRWTQWLFVQMFKAGLAYRKKATVNWCPSCKTVLADEQVMTPKQAGKEPKTMDGKPVQNPESVMVCERCGTVAEKKELEQWFFRITDYAERLLTNLSKIDWPERIKTAQTNWIGKKEGINITYQIKDSKETITVWTSRPDTNFGATFIVVAPEFAENFLLKLLEKDNHENVSKYINTSLSKSKEERIVEGREKTGVFTGLYAINALNNYELPIYVADFVLADVGTGAVVGVPGHDMRDFEFAKIFNLPIKRVVVGPDNDTSEIKNIEQVQEDKGTMIYSEFLDGLDIHEATIKIMNYLVDKGWGQRCTNYHLRDWLISRQRYWGPPIPMIHCGTCAQEGRSWFTHNSQPTTHHPQPLHTDQSDWDHAGWWPEEHLPVELPYLEDYEPEGTGRGPLRKLADFYKTVCPHCGGEAERETDVSDTFLDSAWYFLRYPSVGQKSAASIPFDADITSKWLPVDLYFGGAEHAVLHLMYARFVTMVLNDLQFLSFEEPFPRFYAHGLMIKDGAKMSKSRGNVVNPDEYIEKFGADTLRLYLMFMGPMDGYPDFRDTGIEGMRRFTDKLWKLFQTPLNQIHLSDTDQAEIRAKMHKSVQRVKEDIENFRYNTAIAAIMEYVNELRTKVQNSKKVTNMQNEADMKGGEVWNESLKTLALLLAPFAPHLAEEVWNRYKMWEVGSKKEGKLTNREDPQLAANNLLLNSVHRQRWPEFDPEAFKEDIVEIVVQINGKLRGTFFLSKTDAERKETAINRAKEADNVNKWLEGKRIEKEIYVPGKLVNFVVTS